MTIQKLLGTGACMVIIGISAGVSYGQFQRLTAQVTPSETAQINTPTAAISSASGAEFIAASVTTWTPAEPSNVTPPVLNKPMAFTQPEPPLLSYASITNSTNADVTPALPTYASTPEAVILGTSPKLEATQTVKTRTKTATVKKQASRNITVASAPSAAVTPGTFRRFRGFSEDETGLQDEISRDSFENEINRPNGDGDNVFVRPQPNNRTATPRRPVAISSSARIAQRNARFRQPWATGVYR